MKRINSRIQGHKRLKELANLYGVSPGTFKEWIKPFEDKIGPRLGHFYTPMQVTIIDSCLGPHQGKRVTKQMVKA